MPKWDQSTPSDNLYITELPAGIDNNILKSIFDQYGTVVQHRVLPPSAGMQTKGAAMVRFDSVETASYVLAALDGQIPSGLHEPVCVRFANPPGQGKGQRTGPYDMLGGKVAAAMAAMGDGTGKGQVVVQKDNLYVKNLPATTDENEVRQVFSQYGTVVQVKVMNNQTSCAAFVRLASEDQAAWILQNLNGNIPEGYPGPVDIQTYMKRPVAAVGDLSGESGGKGKGEFSMKDVVRGLEKSGSLPGGVALQNQDQATPVYIQGLPTDCTDIDLYKLFNPFGAIMPQGVRVMLKEDGSCKGIGFVNFQDAGSAEAAVATFNGTCLPDQTHLLVRVKKPAGKDAGWTPHWTPGWTPGKDAGKGAPMF